MAFFFAERSRSTRTQVMSKTQATGHIESTETQKQTLEANAQSFTKSGNNFICACN